MPNKPDEHLFAGVEDDLSGTDVAAEQAAMRARAERTRRRLQMNTALPLPEQRKLSGVKSRPKPVAERAEIAPRSPLIHELGEDVGFAVWPGLSVSEAPVDSPGLRLHSAPATHQPPSSGTCIRPPRRAFFLRAISSWETPLLKGAPAAWEELQWASPFPRAAGPPRRWQPGTLTRIPF
jgi:hypothetical protein